MALTAKAKAINTGAAVQEALLEDFLNDLVAADARGYRYIFSNVWQGVTSGTNLNAKFPDIAARDRPLQGVIIPVRTTLANQRNVLWALEGINIGRIPLTYRIQNAAGELAYT